MKICYIANIRLPTEKAHGIQIMKTCEAFASHGHQVELVVRKRDNPITQNAFDYYGLSEAARKNIRIIYVGAPSLFRLGRIGFWIETWLFAERASWTMHRSWPDVVYSRDYIVLLNMILIHPNIVWETHRGARNWATRLLLEKAKLVTISQGLARLYSEFAKKILVAHDAVDVAQFQIKEAKEECRARTGLPLDKKIVLYCGHLYDWKGAQTFADAALKFSENELAVFVGGTAWDIPAFKEKNKGNRHILILGHKPHADIPFYLKAADALVLPNSAKEKISSHFTSPLKLFEYMASGTPIAASDLPSLREVLSEKTAVFFTPDNSESLLQAVRKMNPTLAAEAFKEVQNHTWEKRASLIESFIQP